MNKICYLCGQPGADSKDHVPPKGLLPESQYGKYQRITIPAHRKCNSAASEDEEYVRDLLVMEGEALSLPKHELITPKIWRSWSGKGGHRRYKSILKTAVPVTLVTEGGLYAGKAIGVTPDVEKIKSVGRKIVKGMIYHDAGALVDLGDMPVHIMKSKDLKDLKNRDVQNPFWIGLCSDHCLHDHCADTIAIRRFYECISCEGVNHVVASFVVVLWNCALLSVADFPLESVTRKGFKLAINTDLWVRTEAARD